MISLVLRGKLPITEDPLTAAFADLLRYEDDANLLKSINSLARPYITGATLPIEYDTYDVSVWPVLDGREPDLRVVLKKRNEIVARIVIEAKLGAVKSGSGEIESETRSGDQLGYYLSHETALSPKCRVSLVYLTHHGAMPREDLAETAEELRKIGCGHLSSELFWISWRDVYEVVERRAVAVRMAADFAALLRKVYMFRFKSFVENIALGTLIPTYFYAARRHSRIYFSTKASLGDLERWVFETRAMRRLYKWAIPPTANGNPKYYAEES